MTTSELSLEQMKRLAEIMYPGKEWCRPILPGHPDYNGGKDTEADYVAYFDFDGPEDLEIRFNPSLTGEDWQQVQALRVIVAAWERCSKSKLDLPYVGNVVRGFVVKQGEKANLLHASALALLGDKT